MKTKFDTDGKQICWISGKDLYTDDKIVHSGENELTACCFTDSGLAVGDSSNVLTLLPTGQSRQLNHSIDQLVQYHNGLIIVSSYEMKIRNLKTEITYKFGKGHGQRITIVKIIPNTDILIIGFQTGEIGMLYQGTGGMFWASESDPVRILNYNPRTATGVLSESYKYYSPREGKFKVPKQVNFWKPFTPRSKNEAFHELGFKTPEEIAAIVEEYNGMYGRYLDDPYKFMYCTQRYKYTPNEKENIWVSENFHRIRNMDHLDYLDADLVWSGFHPSEWFPSGNSNTVFVLIKSDTYPFVSIEHYSFIDSEIIDVAWLSKGILMILYASGIIMKVSWKTKKILYKQPCIATGLVRVQMQDSRYQVYAIGPDKLELMDVQN